MSTLSYYLRICDMELLEDLYGRDWKKNLTIEQIMFIKNKISPFVFCEVVLLWVLDLKPCGSVISLIIDEILSFRLSYWFYSDIASEMFKMGYLRQRHIFNRLRSVENYKYDRLSWLLSEDQLLNFSHMKQIKLRQNCDIRGCKSFHCVKLQLDPLYDNKIRLAKDKFLSLDNECHHPIYSHWYLALSDNKKREDTLFLSTATIEHIVDKLKNCVSGKLYCLAKHV